MFTWEIREESKRIPRGYRILADGFIGKEEAERFLTQLCIRDFDLISVVPSDRKES